MEQPDNVAHLSFFCNPRKNIIRKEEDETLFRVDKNAFLT
jgi:hypothetical protein